MAEVSLGHSYPEPLRVTGPLPSLVLRAEDMWQRYNQCLEVGGALNQGFPFSPLMSHFRGLRRSGIQVFRLFSRPSPVTESAMQAWQDSEAGWEAERNCVRCKQGMCGDFGTRRPSNLGGIL